MTIANTVPRMGRLASRKWRIGISAAVVALGLLVWVLFQVQTPYQLVMPGPVTDVKRLIQPPPPGSGALYLTTVYSDPASAAEWVYAQLSPTADLVPREGVRPPELEHHQHERLLAAMMDESKLAAQVVALRVAGYEVQLKGEGVRVIAVSEESKARGRLEPGDVIVGVDGQPLTNANDLLARIQAHRPGETIALRVRRGGGGTAGAGDGTTRDVEVPLVEAPDEPGRARMGIMALTHLLEVDLPAAAVRLETRGIVGPSAGLVFALGTYASVTETDLTKGRRIGATGTISTDGTVGPVGGVKHKLAAAAAAGAELFLLPEENMADAAGAPASLRVVPVRTFAEALEALGHAAQGQG